MKILVIGNGGREHALAWKAAQSPSVDEVFVAPGNAGTSREAGLTNVDIGVTDIPSLIDFVKENKIDCVLVWEFARLGRKAFYIQSMVNTLVHELKS